MRFSARERASANVMLESDDADINVDQLMYEIRETVVRREPRAGETVAASPVRFSPGGSLQQHAPTISPPLGLQPEFHPRKDNQYQLDDLLKYHGADFVRNAYRAVLKREPDAAGLADHLESLASGRFNKVDVLASLRFSPEGQRSQVRIDGLSRASRVRRLGRVPLLGYLLQVLIAVARLPLMLRHQRQYEFYHSAQQQQIVDHSNRVHQQLSEYSAQLAAALAQTIAGAERDAGQLQALAAQLRELAGRQDSIENRLSATGQALAEQLLQGQQQARAELARLETEARELLRQHARETRTELDGLEEQARQLLRRQQQTQTELSMQERRLTRLLEEARAPAAAAAGPLELPRLEQALAAEEEHVLDALYASFEDQFRGDREVIKSWQRVYLPVLRDAGVSGDVLDIGCGRGEWLEILRDEGVRARGVDRNRVFVEQCRKLGLDVTEADALTHLRGLPAASLNVVTSFHLVEHLPFETLIELLDEMARTLRPGGLLILETPNPGNFMVGSYSFYADPTHRNPIPSPTLRFLLESRGLLDVEVINLRPWDAAKLEGDAEIIKRFNEYFYSSPDYGIIGRKA